MNKQPKNVLIDNLTPSEVLGLLDFCRKLPLRVHTTNIMFLRHALTKSRVINNCNFQRYRYRKSTQVFRNYVQEKNNNSNYYP